MRSLLSSEKQTTRDELIVRFSLSDVQANAILDMRLRSLRRLEEEVLRTERDPFWLNRKI